MKTGVQRRNVRQPTIPGDVGMELRDIARIMGITHQGVSISIKRSIRKLWRRGLQTHS